MNLILHLLLAALAALPGAAAAELYLWKDPATGTVKIYSYPPPWYGNQELERRAPRVERIPERQRAPEPEPGVAAWPKPAPAAAAPGAPPPPPVPKPAADLPR